MRRQQRRSLFIIQSSNLLLTPAHVGLFDGFRQFPSLLQFHRLFHLHIRDVRTVIVLIHVVPLILFHIARIRVRLRLGSARSHAVDCSAFARRNASKRERHVQRARHLIHPASWKRHHSVRKRRLRRRLRPFVAVHTRRRRSVRIIIKCIFARFTSLSFERFSHRALRPRLERRVGVHPIVRASLHR